MQNQSSFSHPNFQQQNVHALIFFQESILESFNLLKTWASQSNDDASKINHIKLIFSLHLAPEFCVYDNACNLHDYCLNRQPSFFANTKFLVDRLHWKNHTGKYWHPSGCILYHKHNFPSFQSSGKPSWFFFRIDSVRKERSFTTNNVAKSKILFTCLIVVTTETQYRCSDRRILLYWSLEHAICQIMELISEKVF